MIDDFENKRQISVELKFMKNCRAILFFLVIFALFCVPVSAQTGQKTELKRIKAYVKTIDSFVKNKKPHLIFADTADENESKAKWRKFASEKALEKFRETQETFTIAYNWRKNGKLVQSTFTLFSSSGDWAQYDSYYFRENGTIAKIVSELRTFYGDVIVLRDLYFDEKGKLIRQTVRYRDLDTNKPIKKPKDDFYIVDVTIYKNVRRLPFAKLLK